MCITKSSKLEKQSSIDKIRIASYLQNLRVEIDAQGNLQHIVNLQKSFDVQFSSQGFYWYQGTLNHIPYSHFHYFYNPGFQGNNSKSEFQPSGAYIFRPLSQTPEPVSTSRTM